MIIQRITREKLEYTAKKVLGYPLHDAEKDYFLALTMKIISQSSLGKQLVFKGGTAIYHCYIKQLRFSEDLDFTSLDKAILLDDFKALFNRFNFLEIKKEYASRATIKIERLKFTGILDMSNSIKVEVDKLRDVYLPSITKAYKNKWELTFKVNVMDPIEICSEKIRATNDRFRYRDFYDLYMLANTLKIDLYESVQIMPKKEIRKPISKSNIIKNLNYALREKSENSNIIVYKKEIEADKIRSFFENLNIPDLKPNV